MPRPRSFDEDAVLDRVVDQFWSHGYEATSLADLESATGLGRQSLYNAFGDKQALFRRVLERYVGLSDQQVAQLRDPRHDGAAALRRYFEASVAVLATPGERRGCFVANTIAEVGDADPVIAAPCRAAAQSLVDGFAEAVRRGRDDGSLDASLDVDETARALQAQAYGLAIVARTGAPRSALVAAVNGLLDRLRPAVPPAGAT